MPQLWKTNPAAGGIYKTKAPLFGALCELVLVTLLLMQLVLVTLLLTQLVLVEMLLMQLALVMRELSFLRPSVFQFGECHRQTLLQSCIDQKYNG